MRHTQCYAERRKPVALKFVAAKIKCPAGNAVKLCHQTFSAKLPGDGLRLLYCGIFNIIAQYVYSGYGERTVGSHGIAELRRLFFKR